MLTQLKETILTQGANNRIKRKKNRQLKFSLRELCKKQKQVSSWSRGLKLVRSKETLVLMRHCSVCKGDMAFDLGQRGLHLRCLQTTPSHEET